MRAMATKSLHDIAAKECEDELTDYTIYLKLSQVEKDSRYVKTFLRLSDMEHGHYDFWKKYCKNADPKPSWYKVSKFMVLRRVFGPSFAIKQLEGNESQAIRKYESMRHLIPQKDRREFESVIADEKEHEQLFASHVAGSYVKYVSFVVLGLADALVEIAGIHAGSLGIYNSTELTGLAGIIAGAAAALSMASAAYAQAKHGFEGSPRLAAVYTGASYYASAIVLALPYFLTKAMALAMGSSLIVGIIIIAFASWYNSIMTGSDFRRNFIELAGIMLAATAILFVFGFIIRSTLGITI
jgi:VIT1/CCC1 family predicted Fe2+/Mn2+ transporter